MHFGNRVLLTNKYKLICSCLWHGPGSTRWLEKSIWAYWIPQKETDVALVLRVDDFLIMDLPYSFSLFKKERSVIFSGHSTLAT